MVAFKNKLNKLTTKIINTEVLFKRIKEIGTFTGNNNDDNFIKKIVFTLL